MSRMKRCKTCYLINAKPCYECSACASGDDHYKYWPNTQTNADRIRSMSDEELAEYLDGISDYATETTRDYWRVWLQQKEEV